MKVKCINYHQTFDRLLIGDVFSTKDLPLCIKTSWAESNSITNNAIYYVEKDNLWRVTNLKLDEPVTKISTATLTY